MKAEQLLSLRHVLAMLLAVPFVFAGLPANASDKPVARLTRFDIKQGQEAAFSKALAETVKQAVAQEGNIMAEAYREEGEPSVLWLIERWSSAEGLELFSKSKQAVSFETLLQTAISKQPDIYRLKDLEPLTKQQWRAVARKGDQPITIMLFVDARAGTQQTFTSLYHTAMPHFRGEEGVVTYQLSEIEGDGTQFVTYEKFRSQDAFQFHLDFPPVKPVVEYLEKNVRQPPFQNGLHNLIEIAPMTRE
ncbi:hypothetical protein GCM10010967_55440 [Dyadobacter beijingensis]|uniref:ABM domain-containing protein n=1 Tax=Dyadobacter beijingensis TaxID=365489 RepID=A0ABQ2IHZ5_9BACT|nr:antibiotic biosynthesis monooxygenase [Dyadobacter beijingensis]GGN12321.1 hypothetical protein GCM10010967_55440 [Dyadobacter beijingensis]